MPRPNPEQRFVSFNETWQTNKNSGVTVRNGVRSYVRTWSGQPRGNYPVKKEWKNHSSLIQSGGVEPAVSLYEYYVGRPDLGWGRYFVGRPGAGVSFSQLDDVQHRESTIQNAANALMDKIADRKINLAQAFAERKQVERLLVNTVKTVSQASHALKRGNVKLAFKLIGFGSLPQVQTLLKGSKKEWRREGRKSVSFRYDPMVLKTAKLDSKQLSDHWLAFQYGVRPLYGDVIGAAELLAQRHFSRPVRFVFRSKASYEGDEIIDGLFYAGLFQVPGKYRRRVTTVCKFTSVYELGSQFSRDVGQTGMSDLLTLGWELTPWSFVVDWALPVGDYLGRLNYSQGLTHVSTLQSVLSTMTGTLNPEPSYSRYVAQHNAVLVRNSSGSFESKCVRFNRTIRGPVTAKFPSWKNPFSPIHNANALALALTRLKVR